MISCPMRCKMCQQTVKFPPHLALCWHPLLLGQHIAAAGQPGLSHQVTSQCRQSINKRQEEFRNWEINYKLHFGAFLAAVDRRVRKEQVIKILSPGESCECLLLVTRIIWRPIGGQYSGLVITLDQSETWSGNLDGAHLLEPLHPGLSLRSPVVTADTRCPRPVSAQPPPASHQHRQPQPSVSSDTAVTSVTGRQSINQRLRPEDTESSFYSEVGPSASLVSEDVPGGQRTINEFELKCGLSWKRFQAALFQCAACCVRCIGPV